MTKSTKGLRLALPDFTAEQGERVRHIVRCVLRATNDALVHEGKTGFDIERVDIELMPDFGPTATGRKRLGLIIEIDI